VCLVRLLERLPSFLWFRVPFHSGFPSWEIPTFFHQGFTDKAFLFYFLLFGHYWKRVLWPHLFIPSFFPELQWLALFRPPPPLWLFLGFLKTDISLIYCSLSWIILVPRPFHAFVANWVLLLFFFLCLKVFWFCLNLSFCSVRMVTLERLKIPTFYKLRFEWVVLTRSFVFVFFPFFLFPRFKTSFFPSSSLLFLAVPVIYAWVVYGKGFRENGRTSRMTYWVLNRISDLVEPPPSYGSWLRLFFFFSAQRLSYGLLSMAFFSLIGSVLGRVFSLWSNMISGWEPLSSPAPPRTSNLGFAFFFSPGLLGLLMSEESTAAQRISFFLPFLPLPVVSYLSHFLLFLFVRSIVNPLGWEPFVLSFFL